MAHGLDMARHGADVVDVGGESSRPGAEPVSEREELAPGGAGDRGAGPARPGVGRHRQAGRGRGGGGRPGRHSSTTSRRRCGRWRRSPGWDGWPCTCRARHAPCSATRATTTSSPRCTAFCATGPARRSRPGWTRCGWTPASASARPSTTTWRCCATSPSSWPTGSPCSWGRVASRFLGRLAPGPAGSPPRVADRLAGLHRHRHVGHAGGSVDGPGPRRVECGGGRHPGGDDAPRAPDRAGLVGAGRSRSGCRWGSA